MSTSLDAASRGKRAPIVAIWPSDSEGIQTEELKIASCDPSPSHSNVTALHVCWSNPLSALPNSLNQQAYMMVIVNSLACVMRPSSLATA